MTLLSGLRVICANRGSDAVKSVSYTHLASHFQLSPHHRYVHCTVGGAIGQEAASAAALLRDFSTYEKPKETAAPLDMQSYKDAMLRGLRQQLPDYMVPVSYTHLDVYKRQI